VKGVQSEQIACDESGYEGEKLIGTTTDVFAHAGVRLGHDAVSDCIRELRDRIRSPATEYKANHLLRSKHRAVLVWLLGPHGPLLGRSHVYLIDKAFFVVGKVVELLTDEPRLAVTLYDEGRRGLDSGHWQAFLTSANDLMRTRDRLDATTSVDSFFQLADLLRTRGPATDVLASLQRARPRAEAFRARLIGDPATIPPMDPLIPAIIRAVDYWGDGTKPVAVAHDRQNALPMERIAQLEEMSGGRLSSLTLVGSSEDQRVQLADILAGTIRKIASDELNGHGDPELTALARPYVDELSVWAGTPLAPSSNARAS
jgi:hypothetical protein